MIDYQPELEEECRRRWPEVRVIANAAERGSCGGRNTGVAAAAGEVVAFLDDDAIAATRVDRGARCRLSPTRA